ncbi:hypothetical protein [Nocardia sp. NBC_01329]|uniref:hypothetical protein n=1 Tax=Nocardia sp. NBC_01329 TaxID=2903594 RepID=UPI002E112955|nr:hypothetical protein OG405_16495 [Nocardia sp. NBC_01329]
MALVGPVRVSTSKQETQRKHDDLDSICVRVFEEKISGTLEPAAAAKAAAPEWSTTTNAAPSSPGMPKASPYARSPAASASASPSCTAK